MRNALIALSLLALAAPLRADSDVSYTRFLIPLTARDQHGAFGSVWSADTWGWNGSGQDALVYPTPFCYSILCADTQVVPPSANPWHLDISSNTEAALLLYVESRYANEFRFATRVADSSRANMSAGVAVPVVPEDELSSLPIRLFDVPVSDGFRTTLRIYALPEAIDPEVDVRYYRMPVATPGGISREVVQLRTERVRLHEPAPQPGDRPPTHPSSVQLANIDALPELAPESDVWIEIVPLSEGLRIWAMASVTNNTTQEVTMITP